MTPFSTFSVRCVFCVCKEPRIVVASLLQLEQKRYGLFHFAQVAQKPVFNGKIIEHREQINRGASENPLSDQDIKDKFFGNATLTVPKPQAEQLLDIVMNLDNQDNLDGLAKALTL